MLAAGLVLRIQSALIRPSSTRVEQFDRLEAGPRRDARRVPEAAHAIDIGRLGKAHMRGELIGEAADLAPAHRIGLAGQRERSHAGPADAAGRQMAIDDRIDLVGAGRRTGWCLASRQVTVRSVAAKQS